MSVRYLPVDSIADISAGAWVGCVCVRVMKGLAAHTMKVNQAVDKAA